MGVTPGAFGLDRAALVGRAFAFGHLGEPPYTTTMVLLADGRIGGYRNPAETLWTLGDEAVLLSDAHGIAGIRLDTVGRVDGRLVLEGPHLASGTRHVLAEVAAGTAPGPGLAAHRIAPDRGRSFLVLTPPGADADPAARLGGAADDRRCWDLCVVDPAPEGAAAPAGCDLACAAPGLALLDAVARLLDPASPLWRYRGFLLADAGLRMAPGDCDRMFAIARAHDLLAARPAAAADDPGADPLFRARPDSLLRFVSHVGRRAPFLSREALALLLPFLSGAGPAGLGQLWGYVLRAAHARVAVVDAVVAALPELSEAERAMASAEEEAIRVRFRFDFASEEYGAIAP